ncbi:hypothetical protein [Phocaeicola coprophilus]|uniref:hypothetical protein n=1 Tax=Phocaeicola coprophilus TaxID=387090 RepID=UPI0039F630E8
MKLGEWGEAYNWDLTDPESWIGIGFQTDENGLKYVNKISIVHGKNIECSLPSSLGNLKYLSEFSLGGIPYLKGPLPESIYNCPISIIGIVNCPRFEDKLSSKIAQWKNTLVELTINRTSFYGEIPKEIGECQSLAYLSLTSNKFSGIIPAEIGKIPCFPIHLNHNEFTGIDWSIYTEKYGNTGITAAYNNFIGEIPQEVLDSEQWNNSYHSFYPFNEGYGFTNYPLDENQLPK